MRLGWLDLAAFFEDGVVSWWWRRRGDASSVVGGDGELIPGREWEPGAGGAAASGAHHV